MAVRQAIEASFGDVRREKLIRRAIELSRLAELMLAEHSDGVVEHSGASLARIHRMINELDQGAKEQNSKNIGMLCESALPVVETLCKSVKEYQQKDLELLMQLSLVQSGATQPDEDGANLVHDIVATIGGKI